MIVKDSKFSIGFENGKWVVNDYISGVSLKFNSMDEAIDEVANLMKSFNETMKTNARKQLNVGDSVKFKDGRTGIVEEYNNTHYFVKDNNGNVVKVKKVKDWIGFYLPQEDIEKLDKNREPISPEEVEAQRESERARKIQRRNAITAKPPVISGYEIEEIKTAEEAKKGYLTKEQGRGWVVCGSESWGANNERYFDHYSDCKLFLYSKNGEPYYMAVIFPSGQIKVYDREDREVKF